MDLSSNAITFPFVFPENRPVIEKNYTIKNI